MFSFLFYSETEGNTVGEGEVRVWDVCGASQTVSNKEGADTEVS